MLESKGSAMKFLFTLFAFFLFHPINAEIQSVQLRWTTGFCNTSCMQLLAKYLSQMPGVAGVNMNLQLGEAVLNWQPNAPFSLLTISNTVARVGVFMDNIHVTVRGTLQARGNTFYLVSIGDNTAFILLGPLEIVPGKAISPYSIQSYPLTPYLVSELTQAMQNNLVALVEGSLNIWQGTQTLYLSIDKLSFVVSQ